MIVVLGNRKAVTRRLNDDETVTVMPGPKGKQATYLDTGDDATLLEAFQSVVASWPLHAEDGHTPPWVASDSPALASMLAEQYDAEVRELEDPYAGRLTGVAAAVTGGAASLVGLHIVLAVVLFVLARVSPYLKTNAGNDFQANQMAGTPSATAIAKYVAITANTTAPAAGDTTLTGEITTAGGGLVRKAGTYAHTTGAASYTLTTVFTANGTDALPVTIGKRGIFDAASAGNMVFETLVTPTATLSASGDQLTLTDTVNL